MKVFKIDASVGALIKIKDHRLYPYVIGATGVGIYLGQLETTIDHRPQTCAFIPLTEEDRLRAVKHYGRPWLVIPSSVKWELVLDVE